MAKSLHDLSQQAHDIEMYDVDVTLHRTDVSLMSLGHHVSAGMNWLDVKSKFTISLKSFLNFLDQPQNFLTFS